MTDNGEDVIIDGGIAKKAKIDADSNAVTALASLASGTTPLPDAADVAVAVEPPSQHVLVDEKKQETEDMDTKNDPTATDVNVTATVAEAVDAATISTPPVLDAPPVLPAPTTNEGGDVVFDPSMPSPAAGEETPFHMSQSERKRYREKQRRQNISSAIDALTKVLVKVDPTNFIEHNNQVYFATEKASITEASSESSFRKRRSSAGFNTSHHHQPLNRTEVINHATVLIEKLAAERDDVKMRMHGGQPVPTSSSNSEAPKGGSAAPTAAMVPQYPMQGGQPQLMMVANGAHPPTIMMPPAHYFPQYVVNGNGQPGVMQWAMQPQQYAAPGAPAQEDGEGVKPEGEKVEEAKDATEVSTSVEKEEVEKVEGETAQPSEKSGESENIEAPAEEITEEPEKEHVEIKSV